MYRNSSVLYKKLSEDKKVDTFLDELFTNIPIEDYLCDYKESLKKLRDIEINVVEGYVSHHILPFLQIKDCEETKHIDNSYYRTIDFIHSSICIKDYRFVITEGNYYVETHFFYHSKYKKGVWLGFGNLGHLYVLNNNFN